MAEADWITVHDVTALDIVRLLQPELDTEGETEAIALAHQLGAKIVLLDERDARRAAKRLGLHALGTIGVLIWGKQTGKLASLRDALDALQSQASYFLADGFMRDSTPMRQVGEM